MLSSCYESKICIQSLTLKYTSLKGDLFSDDDDDDDDDENNLFHSLFIFVPT
jgi:hypothetical protein